jgi:Ala-tRNA(Pro) deacylase
MHQKLHALLDSLNISYTNHTHVPVFTVEESNLLGDHIPGAHTKNLFLKNNKGEFFLVSMLHDGRLDIRQFQKEINKKDLSFASADHLRARLRLDPGSVTPFGLIHDPEGVVTFILDQDILGYETVNFHPLRNDMTTGVTSQDFLRFLKHIQHEPLIMKLPKL